MVYGRRLCSRRSTMGPSAVGDALDVLVVQHPGGQLTSTAWHVVFSASRAHGGRVRLWVNSSEVQGTAMYARVGRPAVFANSLAQDEQHCEQPSASAPPQSILHQLVNAGILTSGRNEVVYELCANGGGCVTAFLYLWASSTPVVVFDVDGTVTQADVVGHFGQAMGLSFTHRGVCEFACHIHSRGYGVMFLSARPLCGPTGIERTRRFLFDMSHDESSGFSMPYGPVFTTSHTSTVAALIDEMTKVSAQFKTATLRMIAALFAQFVGQYVDDETRTVGAHEGSDTPELLHRATDGAEGVPATDATAANSVAGLYAGFGNRSKDATAYMAAGINASRIFIIDERSKIMRWSTQSSVPIGQHSLSMACTPVIATVAAPTSCKWQSYSGMLESLAQEFPLRCQATNARHILEEHIADATERVTSSGAPRRNPCSCLRDTLL